jgi:hypothetical protein
VSVIAFFRSGERLVIAEKGDVCPEKTRFQLFFSARNVQRTQKVIFDLCFEFLIIF